MPPLVHLPVPRRLPTWAEAGIAQVLALCSSGTHLSRLWPSVWSAALGSSPEAPVPGQTRLGHPRDPGLAWCVPWEEASSRAAVGVLMGAWCVAVASRDRPPPRTGSSAGDSPRVPGKGTGRTPGQAEGGPVARKCGGPLGASTAPRAPSMDAEWSRPWVGGGRTRGPGGSLLAGRGPWSPVGVPVLMGGWTQDSRLSWDWGLLVKERSGTRRRCGQVAKGRVSFRGQ